MLLRTSRILKTSTKQGNYKPKIFFYLLLFVVEEFFHSFFLPFVRVLLKHDT